jgi:hypothetical protein
MKTAQRVLPGYGGFEIETGWNHCSTSDGIEDAYCEVIAELFTLSRSAKADSGPRKALKREHVQCRKEELR